MKGFKMHKKKKYYTFYLDINIMSELKKIAEEDGRKLGWLIEKSINKYIKEYNEQNKG